MTYSKNIYRLVNEIVSLYSRYNPIDKEHIINLEDVSDFDLHELAAKIMLEDAVLASEANGPDNPAFETKMLPALINFMSNSTSKDESIEFVREWRDGVTSYFNNAMAELLSESVERLNSGNNDVRYTAEKYLSTYY